MINNLPSGWRIEELGNLKLDISDGNYSSLYPTQNEFVENGIPFIRANNIYKNTIIEKDMRFISKEKHSILKKGQLKQNDLLFTNRGIIGQVGLVPDKYIGANINAQIVRINSGNKYTNKYLMYCFLRQKLKNQMITLQTGSTLKQLPIKQLKKLQVSIPPLQQQERIVRVLDLTSNLIEKQKELLKKYDLFLKSKFIEMFGDPISNPMGWEVVSIIDACNKITDGTHYSPPMIEKGFKYITAKHIKENKLNFKKDETYISEEEHRKIFSRCNPVKGDVLYIKDGATTGIACINTLEEEFSLLSSVALLKPSEKIKSEYIVSYLNNKSVKQNILLHMAGGAIKRLTIKKIKDIKIPLPHIGIQNQFASIVKKIEIIKEKENKKLKQLEDLHNSLMQKAFKGEIQ